MDENRVKDPLGEYERVQNVVRPDTTWTGLKVAVVAPLLIAGAIGGVWGVVLLLRGLFG